MAPEDDKKTESDVEPDDKVAQSRAGEDADGAYVGQASSDDDFDSGETGAEARSGRT
ncbi:hypothetical protein [[Mycobacterium] burgundiense]|uniref:Autophagy-related protein 2 n=1 Tax=[Mycobacterium] burgundiense TaxID=3064286 RepID=A0ABM9M550_9MYCO|nr:hypothetical protein [Mycolicibacterium sp. MU0053]CAJ1510312.1 hypothetical protein MU0053_004548 [Mycolicibacterium sp. MU0053]